MSLLFARNRIRLTVAALAISATVTAVGATAQAAPVSLDQPSPDTTTAAPVATSSGSSAFGVNWDPGMITASAAAPISIVAVILCGIGLSTGSTKVTPGNDNPCLPI
ncbi:hypothetical protein ACFXG4_15395 [Nocardia sp. NPDC059246]|uniref:hypothetical protein n=1 Tax=unclassified Nocardia TaxID=2637762 RepID=UPI0036822932